MSNQNNFFSLGRKLFDNESITMDDFRNHITKRKEKQILEHRKKIMKDIYTKMFSNSLNKIENNNINVQIQNKNNNMEIEDEINILLLFLYIIYFIIISNYKYKWK